MTVGPRTALASFITSLFYYVKWYTAKQNGDLKCAALASHRYKKQTAPHPLGQGASLIFNQTENHECRNTGDFSPLSPRDVIVQPFL